MDGQDCAWEAKRYKIGHTRLESHYVIKSDLSRHIPLKKKKSDQFVHASCYLLFQYSV